MFSFLTSLVTTNLTFIMESRPDSMTGRHVGVLKYRDYDATLVVSEGGVVVETQGSLLTNFRFILVFNFWKDNYLLQVILLNCRYFQHRIIFMIRFPWFEVYRFKVI